MEERKVRIATFVRKKRKDIIRNTEICHRVGMGAVFLSVEHFCAFCMSNQGLGSSNDDIRHAGDTCEICGVGKKIKSGMRVQPGNINTNKNMVNTVSRSISKNKYYEAYHDAYQESQNL